MATLYVDNQPHSFEGEHRNLLDVCLSLGFDVPYFCWHPAMHSVGACRQCAIKQFKDEHDTRGKLVMACMTQARDGTRISIDDEEAREFRAHVIEWLMVNHPHDCPVCDEGGECHLQDMTVMTGHVYRKYRFTKRTHRNQYLGPFLTHEMNRCIQCYRCVRFYRDYAGGRDFNVFGWHDDVYFGRHRDGVLESPFAGNLVEVCPTGVFDDKTLWRHYTRKWDLQTAPSICVHCALGCNTIPAERYGSLRRVRARYNHAVNGYFLCDRGRYGYEFVNSDERIRQPLLRGDDGLLAFAPPEDALAGIESLLRDGGCLGIGSARASLESNAALRILVGPVHFSHGMTEAQARLIGRMLEILRTGPAPSASLKDCERADGVLVLGEDVTNVAPMLALALRQAVRNQPLAEAMKRQVPPWMDAAVREAIQADTGPFFVVTPDRTALDEIATVAHRAAPQDIARLGFAVAHVLDPRAASDPAGSTPSLAARIANALSRCARPLVVCGGSCANQAMVEAAANIAWALQRRGRDARLCWTVEECNSMGTALLGGISLEAAARRARDGHARTVIILEKDLLRQTDPATADALLSVDHVIVLDHLHTGTTARAQIILPTAPFAESDGTLVNNEVRAQRFYQVCPAQGSVRQGWRWIAAMMVAAGRAAEEPWPVVDDLTAAVAAELPILAPIQAAAPPGGLRIAGQQIPRQPHRYSGRTAMHAHLTVHEPPPPTDANTPLAFSMEGFEGQPPAALVPRFWAPGWNSVQAINRFQEEIAGPLRGGPAGRRLIEPPGQDRGDYFTGVPDPFQPRTGQWLILPAYRIFGSEELSRRAPGIAELTPPAFLVMRTEDAEHLAVLNDQAVILTIGPLTRRVKVRCQADLPTGIAMWHPAAAPGTPDGDASSPTATPAAFVLPAWGRIDREGP